MVVNIGHLIATYGCKRSTVLGDGLNLDRGGGGMAALIMSYYMYCVRGSQLVMKI